MTALRKLLPRLATASEGSVVIETAFVVPFLAILAFGGFETSHIISRHNELQVAAAEAMAVVLANSPEDATERAQIEEIVEASTGLAADKVTLKHRYRCNAATTLVNLPTLCGVTDVISEYIVIEMRDSYTPVWTEFGLGSQVDFVVDRRVQIS